MLIDAHHHLWQYNERDYVWMTGAMTSLRRDFLISNLEGVAREAGVDGFVAVQARQTLEETEWLLGLANRHEVLLGVVGWVPLVAPNIAEHLGKFAGEGKLKAVRHVLHDEPDEFYMLRPDFNRGIDLLKNLGLAYDLLVFENHLPQTIQFVDEHPGQVFVLDHIAKPKIKAGEISPWKERIRELAKRENVYCKVSGMVTEADWKRWATEQLQPYFDIVLAAFSPRRLMYGSDWPVLTLASTYPRWVSSFRTFISQLSPTEQEEISAGTARRAYRLG